MYSKKIDQKWQKKWSQIETNRYDKNKENTLYCTEMFSYPSGANLHIGHWFNYSLVDIWVRMKRLQGYNVFHPMGFDAFGLPAENYAIKMGVHPQKSTYRNIRIMTRQLEEMGASYDFDYKVVTADEGYYRWTQWLFLKLYENGMAYRKEGIVNWCNNCNTVLANEQVIEGKCERCGSNVMHKKKSQWYFRITKYADRLLEDIDNLDWPEKTKKIQKNWIGKEKGYRLIFIDVVNMDRKYRAFVTELEKIRNAIAVVIDPEYYDDSDDNLGKEIKEYIQRTKQKSILGRKCNKNKRCSIYTGEHVYNPYNGTKLPVFIGDYVIANNGMNCTVICEIEHDMGIKKYYQNRTVNLKMNQDCFNKDLIQEYTYYSLHDWSVSRQRYWGTPIPIIYCEKCGILPVPEEDLPVRLPANVHFKKTGESPLNELESFLYTKCPCCGAKARREVDTMDTFVDSSWYFFRYVDNKNSKKIFDKEKVNAMLPVDLYVGGAEHATMHLLYARFITKFLYDIGYVNCQEPFKKLVHQGVILGRDGSKMSKSKGNTINPDYYVDLYGADVLRGYLAFGFSFSDGGSWNDNGILAIKKFYERIEKHVKSLASEKNNCKTETNCNSDEIVVFQNRMSKLICSVQDEVEKLHFNVALAKIMELYNVIRKYKKKDGLFQNVFEATKQMLIVLSCFAPHFAEEQWYELGQQKSIHFQKWPSVNENDNTNEEKIIVQINGKFKYLHTCGGTKEEIVKEAIKRLSIDEQKIIKVIFIKNKVLNFVTN